MKRIPKLLSKTKLMRGYRCLKSIYLTIHQPELEPPVSPELQALFDQGNEVGKLARDVFPGGTLVDNLPWDFVGSLQKTRELIQAGHQIIYEAAFEHLGCYARADIIQYNPASQKWLIYEAKSTTKVKPEHIDDIGLQAWIMSKSKLPIEKIHLMHLNTDCRFPDLSNLFKIEDVTEDIRQRYLSIQPKLLEIFNTIKQPVVPDISPGAYCLTPNPCPFVSHCWQENKIPDMSILNLPGMHQRKWQLYQEGIIELDDPGLTDLTEIQQRIINTHKTKQRYLNKEGVKSALAEWTYPFVFLDFETINPAIPCYDNSRPYQQIPFQFSVHTMESPDATVTHQAFLFDKQGDPRPDLIKALLKACGDSGSIIAYYGKFEADRIKELSEYCPEQSEPLNALIERIVDPLPVIREHIYDEAFAGSFSLKKVAPALLGQTHSYAGMEVADGGAAQRAYQKLISNDITAKEKQDLKQAMLEYCEKDTLVMVDLVKWMMTFT